MEHTPTHTQKCNLDQGKEKKKKKKKKEKKEKKKKKKNAWFDVVYIRVYFPKQLQKKTSAALQSILWSLF